MLAGEAVVAIWNGIAPEARAEFYAWHIREHMPERVGIPGFRRGRRYIAADGGTRPEFLTLYEVDTMEVLQGADYLGRLNAPTPWTRATTAQFRDTSRALARVLESHGPGGGGVALTLRFDPPAGGIAGLLGLVREVAGAVRVTGAHLCAADDAASARRTAETEGRGDILVPPSAFVLVEATDAEALAPLFPEEALRAAGVLVAERGIYRLEHTRCKTAFAAG